MKSHENFKKENQIYCDKFPKVKFKISISIQHIRNIIKITDVREHLATFRYAHEIGTEKNKRQGMFKGQKTLPNRL